MRFSRSRRAFLRAGVAGGAFLSLPASIYRTALGADVPPSEKVRLGFIGLGGQGTGNMNAFLKHSHATVAAVCDVDSSHLAKAAGVVEKATKKAPQAEKDFRKLLDTKDVDAVVVSTPDHWHALTTVAACAAGKDVYCEKPLTLVIGEGQAMVAAARKHGRIVQTGSQQRSDARFRQACELARNGALGKVHTVKVGLPGPNFKAPGVPDSTPPAELDYEFWLGPAPARPYNEKRVHYLFRFFWDYSGGQQTNFGAHHLDIAQWGLGMDESGPVSIEATAQFNKEKWFETPEVAKITYTYANGVKILCSLGKGGYPGGTTFEGDKGSIFVDRSKITATPPEILKSTGGDVKLYVSNNHHGNWLDCIKTRKLPICDVAIGHRSATVCHLGNIAVRTGRKIAWDPAKEQIVGDAEAAKMTTKEYRAPWKLA
ncbi:Gfo/Idh/MocA family protein [Fimbriiglobus ruber]|uniref:Myo-inositol 2-dehydrogenase n=1 Tax=Fimbriiglobus ruber TaxID=1908690 RepID=A0A225DFQ8_9BACT|nr:Gfo/Idh/MocA family oxidoreductase [Fimbriiglobus ruber]OWK36186.1 Myo-inositol 2-dehydrogenase [Fimbriiglobus ruber]